MLCFYMKCPVMKGKLYEENKAIAVLNFVSVGIAPLLKQGSSFEVGDEIRG